MSFRRVNPPGQAGNIVEISGLTQSRTGQTTILWCADRKKREENTKRLLKNSFAKLSLIEKAQLIEITQKRFGLWLEENIELKVKPAKYDFRQRSRSVPSPSYPENVLFESKTAVETFLIGSGDFSPICRRHLIRSKSETGIGGSSCGCKRKLSLESLNASGSNSGSFDGDDDGLPDMTPNFADDEDVFEDEGKWRD